MSGSTTSHSEGHDSGAYKVLVNEEGQHCIWPESKPNALGWVSAGFNGPKSECLAFVREQWTDLRPRSLQRLMSAEEQAAASPT